jgi:cytochrome P450
MEKPELKSLPLPPGKSGLPFIGEGLRLITNPNNFINQFPLEEFQKYGDIFKTELFGQLVIYVKGAEANRFFLTSPNIEPNLPPSMQILLGDSSVSNQKGDIHKNRRQIIAQSFQPRNLDAYFDDIVAITENYLDKWEKQGQITWYSELQDYTFDVALKFLMGIDNASSSPLKNLYETFELGLFSPLPLNLPFTRFGKAFQSRKKIFQEIEAIILARKQQSNWGTDTLAILLQAEDEQGNLLSLEELKNQMLTLLFTGYSTLTSSLTSFNWAITEHPQVLNRLREEQKRFNKPLSKEQLKEMTYLDQVLKEVLRLNPPLVSGFRKVVEDCSFKGYLIPKNCALFYHISATHRNPQTFPEPEQFNPENFNLPKKEKPFSYVPFGGGMRECLGKEFAKLEMKILTALLIRNYHWSLIPEQDLSLEMLPAPHPQDGLKVTFSKNDDV